nr:hypothetical protein [Tanacetum cinerariifolium]
SDDGVTTALQLSQNSRPPMLDHQDKYMMKAQDVRGLTNDQFQNEYDKIRRAVDLAITKDHHQHLKRSGETLESLESKKLKSSHSTEQPAELQEPTSVSASASIAAGVSTTAGASGSASEATVPIIELLDSPPKDTSIPLDPETEEQDVPLRKSSRKKYIARRRTLLSPSKLNSDALLFDKDDPEASFKRYLRQASNDDKPAEPVSLALRFSTLRELMYWAGRADLMVLYGMVSDNWRFYALPAIHVLETKAGDIIYMFMDKKYPLTPEIIQRMLNHGLEIDRDPTGCDEDSYNYDLKLYILSSLLRWFQITCSSKIQQSQAEGIQRCSWCFKFHIQDPNVAVDTSCCSTLNPYTALMTIYYWKQDNKQVTIQFRGGLLGIVIHATRVFCSCRQVFISAGVLFLLVVLRCCC